MGSVVATVTLAGTTPERAAPAIEAVFERVEWSMNEWRAGSPLAQLNAGAGRGWVPLPGRPVRGALVREGRGTPNRRTVRPHVGGPVDLWRFDGSAPAPPPEAAVRARCGLVDHRLLQLRPRARACEARLARAGMRVGLGGLAARCSRPQGSASSPSVRQR